LPGYYADAFIFDPDTIGLDRRSRSDFPAGRPATRPGPGDLLDDRERRPIVKT